MNLCSTAGRVATGPVDTRSGTVVQGPDSNWESGPSRQGGHQSAEVVPLVLRLGFLQVQPGSVALGVVVLTALLARLVRKSIAAGVWLEWGEKGQEGDCSWLRSLARMCANTLPLPG